MYLSIHLCKVRVGVGQWVRVEEAGVGIGMGRGVRVGVRTRVGGLVAVTNQVTWGWRRDWGGLERRCGRANMAGAGVGVTTKTP